MITDHILEIVDGLLTENRDKLNRLLELYLNGDFSMDVLESHKHRLETTINALSQEQMSLQNQLKKQTLSNAQIKGIQEFMIAIRPEIETANFESRQRIVSMLNVETTLVIEEEKKIVYVRCAISQESALDCDAYNVFFTTRGSAYCTFAARLSVDY